VPPPKTAYEDIYILGIGDAAEVISANGKVEINLNHRFPFLNANRMTPGQIQPDEDLNLEMLAEATICRIDPLRPSFLFHSAGKDSNSIALALAEAGWQDKVTLITHKSKGAADESEISAKIAKQLGFKHQVLHEVDQLKAEHHAAIEDYFVNAPFPCTDNVTLAYPLYSVQMPELRGANVIDGGGNDSYMMTPPTKRELKTHELAKWTAELPGLRNYVKSESVLNPLLRTQAEWYGMAGLSLADANRVYPGNSSVHPHWNRESKKRQGWDIYDFKTDILTGVTAAELHIRKVRIFAEAIDANFALPFANAGVANYFAKMPETYLIDRETLKNKLILRKILKDRIGLDSDALGKMGFSYDSRSIVMQNWESITREIYACSLWDKPGLEKIVNRMRLRMDGKGWGAGAAGRLLYRIYLVSFWGNRCRWI
jgi:asparagine synthase (glutamine-hydrolysing)